MKHSVVYTGIKLVCFNNMLMIGKKHHCLTGSNILWAL